jgi:hypothetical protein
MFDKVRSFDGSELWVVTLNVALLRGELGLMREIFVFHQAIEEYHQKW